MKNLDMKNKFGSEEVQLNSQVYQSSFHMNYLMNLTIFGNHPQYSFLWPYETVHITKNEVVIHISSHRQIDELLGFMLVGTQTMVRYLFAVVKCP